MQRGGLPPGARRRMPRRGSGWRRHPAVHKKKPRPSGSTGQHATLAALPAALAAPPASATASLAPPAPTTLATRLPASSSAAAHAAAARLRRRQPDELLHRRVLADRAGRDAHRRHQRMPRLLILQSPRHGPERLVLLLLPWHRSQPRQRRAPPAPAASRRAGAAAAATGAAASAAFEQAGEQRSGRDARCCHAPAGTARSRQTARGCLGRPSLTSQRAGLAARANFRWWRQGQCDLPSECHPAAWRMSDRCWPSLILYARKPLGLSRRCAACLRVCMRTCACVRFCVCGKYGPDC